MMFSSIQVKNEQCQIARQRGDDGEDENDDDDDNDDNDDDDDFGEMYNSPDPSSDYKWKNFTVSSLQERYLF